MEPNPLQNTLRNLSIDPLDPSDPRLLNKSGIQLEFFQTAYALMDKAISIFNDLSTTTYPLYPQEAEIDSVNFESRIESVTNQAILKANLAITTRALIDVINIYGVDINGQNFSLLRDFLNQIETDYR